MKITLDYGLLAKARDFIRVVLASLVGLNIITQLVLPYSLESYFSFTPVGFSLSSVLIVLATTLAVFHAVGQSRFWPVEAWLITLVILALVSHGHYDGFARAIIIWFALIFCVFVVMRDKEFRVPILTAILLIALIASVQVILASLYGTSVFLSLLGAQDLGKYGLDARAGFGFTYNSVQASFSLLFGIAAAIALKEKLGLTVFGLLLLIFCIALVLVGSRAASFAAFAMIFWLAIVRRCQQALVLMLAMIGAILICETGDTLSIYSPDSAVGKAGGYRMLADEFVGASPDLDLTDSDKATDIDVNPDKVIDVDAKAEPVAGQFRFQMHKIGWELFKHQPILGYGLASFPAQASLYVEQHPDVRSQLLGIDGNNELARSLGVIVEQKPSDYGLFEKQWTRELLLEVAKREYPDLTLGEVKAIVNSGQVRAYGELSEGLDSHSLYLSLLVETGLFGIIVFLGFLVVNGLRSTVAVFGGKRDEDTDFLAAVTCLIVGTSVVGVFWHILAYRETAIVVGLFLSALPFLKRSQA